MNFLCPILQLASLFSDGAVLQHGKPISVWGWGAEPRAIVTVSINGVAGRCFADAAGAFFLRLPPQKAGGPYVLTVSDGKTRREVSDIYIGEVWFAGGQSNMALPFRLTPEQWQEFQELPPDPLLRMFTVPHSANMCKAQDTNAKWQKASDFGNAVDFSAVAAWFGHRLRKELNVPIGIVNASFGSSVIESWISPNTLRRIPETAEQLHAMDHTLSISNIFDKPEMLAENYANAPLLERFGRRDPGNKGFGNGWADINYNDADWQNYHIPGNWTTQGLSGNGVYWARKTVEIPAEWAGQDLLFSLGGIDKSDITYFNGVEIGRTGGGFSEEFWNVPRKYKIPGKFVKPGKAVLAIRMYSFVFNGGCTGKPQDYFLAPADRSLKSISMEGIWKGKAEIDWGIVQEILPNGPSNRKTPGILFDEMIRPLLPFAVRGIIFYQGESNTTNVKRAYRYKEFLKALIEDWRFQWEQGDLPFYFVLLAPFGNPAEYQETSSWARLRESQRQVAKQTPNCDYVVISDAGNAQNIHPEDKKTVGYRLAALALHRDYQRTDILCHGPRPLSLQRIESSLLLEWENCEEAFSGGTEWKKGFYLAGCDKIFYPADRVEANGNKLFVYSEKVFLPQYLRYQWADFPIGGFCNSAGIPAEPFEISTEEN